VIGSCTIRAPSLPEGVTSATVQLECSTGPGHTSSSDNEGNEHETNCELGLITIEVPPPTNTPTNSPTATNTVPPEVATNTPTRTNTVPPSGGDDDDDDGCHIAAQGGSDLSWLLLAPAAILVLRRRRAK
jgi:hypothetical protein